MVERISRIVCEVPWERASANTRRNALITARAVIREMREPTEAMALQGRNESVSEGAHDCEVPMSQIYRAMIDEALKE